MNLQSYSTAYAENNGIDFASVKKDTVVITLNDTEFDKNYVLKLAENKKVLNVDRPKIRAIVAFYRVEAKSTLFSTDGSWSLLLGNEKMVYPSHEGRVYQCATPYFVKEPAVLSNMFPVTYSENVYAHKTDVVYLDQYDIPSPGSNYFDAQPDPEYYRICYITMRVVGDGEIEKMFENVKGVCEFPLKTKSSLADLSPFVQSALVNDEVVFSDTYYESTNLVSKNRCYKDPDAILVDILDSYPEKSARIGIVVEYPIRISFTATETSSSSHRKFVAFAVNCNAPPKRVLYVPAPYDRYYEYRYPPSRIQWIHLYYDGEESVPSGMKTVALAKTVIGYVYKDTFFCLLYPKLTRFKKNKNTQYLLNTLNFDLGSDPNMQIVQSYRFDARHTLICVKHRYLPHEMWCMKAGGSAVSYAKAIGPSYLVREWSELVVDGDARATAKETDISLVKLMFILDRHSVCYYTKQTNGSRKIRYENEKDIVFYLEPKLLEFVNKLRQSVELKKQSDGCVIL